MQYKCIYLIIILLCALNLKAQIKLKPANIRTGQEFRNKPEQTFNKIVTQSENGIIVWKTDNSVKTGSQTILQLYSNELNEIESLNFDFKHKNGTRELITVIDFKENVLVFSCFTDIFRHEVEVYVEAVNKLLFQKSSIKKIASYKYEGAFYKGVCDVVLSPDSSKFALLLSYKTASLEMEEIHVECFENENEPLWKEEVKIPFLTTYYEHSKNGLSMIYTYILSDSSMFYMSYLAYENTILYNKKTSPNNSFHVLRLGKNCNKAEVWKIERNGLTTNSLTLIPNPQNKDQLICSGFYSSYSGVNSANGLFYKMIDYKLNKMTADTLFPFPMQLKAEFTSERQAKKGKELFNFAINEFLFLADSSVLLVAEEKVDLAFTRSGSSSLNSILVSKFKINQPSAQFLRIAKSQSPNSSDYPHSSYSIMQSADERTAYIFFNDHPNNLFIEKTERVFNFDFSREAIFVLVTIHPNFTLNRETLFIIETKDTYPCPTISYSTNSNKLIMLSKNFNQHQLFEVQLNE